MATAAPPSPPNRYCVQPHRGKLRFLYPVPNAVYCAVRTCKGSNRNNGAWIGEQRHLDLMEHYEKRHKNLYPFSFSICFKCSICEKIFDSIHTAGRHHKICDRRASASFSTSISTTNDSLQVTQELESSSTPVEDELELEPTRIEKEGRKSRLILKYPGRPSTCPKAPKCDWHTGARRSRAMYSMHRHVLIEHKESPEKMWECDQCGVVLDGMKMSPHYRRHEVSTPGDRTRARDSASTLRADALNNRATSTAPRPHIGRSKRAARPSPSPGRPPVLTPTGSTPATTTSTTGALQRSSLFDWNVEEDPELPPKDAASGGIRTPTTGVGGESAAAEQHESTYINRDALYTGLDSTPRVGHASRPITQQQHSELQHVTSDDTEVPTIQFSNVDKSPAILTPIRDELTRGEQDDASGDHGPGVVGEQGPHAILEEEERGPAEPSQPMSGQPNQMVEGTFAALWAGAFRNCQSQQDLDGVLARCCDDWVHKASGAQNTEQEAAPIRGNNPQVEKRPRHQSRQVQRIRQKKSRNADKARQIQKLFKVYPRRAVRQVMGEKSPRYTGTKEDAEVYLKRTYQRSTPSNSQCDRAKKLYDACQWSTPDEDMTNYLVMPPSREEIQMKLKKAMNSAPGADGLEYRHLRSLDPTGQLLEEVFATVCRLGVPGVWKRSRVIPIHKKGETTDYSNFRPISLISTLYRLFTGVLSQRLNMVASSLGWLSPEQKGFLPGVQGIQEHTQLLQTAIEMAEDKRRPMSVAWLDLCNAFGSIPHAILKELFESLPIPAELRRLLNDLYSGNVMDFVVGNESVVIAPTAGVRQGDPLSSTVFNLAAEPLLRAAKSSSTGFSLFGQTVKVTSYADDLAVIANSAVALQETLDHLSRVATVLGLKFNSSKCASLSFMRGRPIQAILLIDGGQIRCLGPEDKEIYLGIPLGAKLRFRPDTDLLPKLDLLANSLLAPWQKLEVYRSHLLPSLSHYLASGRVAKKMLEKYDTECRKFLGFIARVPNTAVTEFFYADRRVGGLGTCRLGEDADIWTLARATQLLTSNDPLVRDIAREQLNDTIVRGFRESIPNPLPLSEFLSGSSECGLYRLKYGVHTRTNIWTLARRAADRLNVRIDYSGDRSCFLIADEISSHPLKAVRGLRKVVRERNTKKFVDSKHQGRVASALALGSNSKDMARLISCRTELGFDDWNYLHRARLNTLPLRGYSWSRYQNTSCRRCGQEAETGLHVINKCQSHLGKYTERHDSILELLRQIITEKGYAPKINRALTGQQLRPDVQMLINSTKLMVDVVVAYDDPGNLEKAYNRKIGKYQDFGKILPLVVGSLGSWPSSNDDIRSFLGINGRKWGTFRRKACLLAIKGSIRIIQSHLSDDRGNQDGDAEDENTNDDNNSGNEDNSDHPEEIDE